MGCIVPRAAQPMSTCQFCGVVAKQHWRRGPDRFAQCGGCGVVFRDTTAGYKAATADYHAAIAAETDWEAETPVPVLATYAHDVQRTLRPRGTVLDFGTGTGVFVHALREAGVNAQGVEPSAIARATAKDRFGLTLSESLSSLAREQFCGVTAIEVIEHLPDPEWLTTVRNLLTPGGFILITTPNRNSLAARLSGAKWPQATNPFHVVLFNAKALSGTLRRAGFVHPTLLRNGPVFGRTVLHRATHRLLLAAGMHSSLRMVAWTPSPA